MYNYHLENRSKTQHKGQLIKVNGEGELAVQPDLASINLGIISEGKELLPTQQQNAIQSTEVIQSLVKLGIPQTQIQTFDYRMEPEYDYEQGKQLFRGYKVTHILQVKIEDLTMIGKVVDTAVQNGGNYVSNIQFTVKNKEPYYQRALVLAVNNAISKAKTIADSINVNLIPTPSLLIEGSSSPNQPFSYQPETLVKAMSTTQLEPGQIKIKANISAEFQYLRR
ncbi:SIMPL domain-containing protein [Bacillus sp. SORGH_AS_0510]|uniref:SIMPL domain-containing protein n=1 Tax=Bacillus sp. SORGH_AS_0510 TaxID=3041771 RepID=UPI0027D80084|nr:SIMPL domain-containing protein [Bacillus sp. SORGH_AS_0510]